MGETRTLLTSRGEKDSNFGPPWKQVNVDTTARGLTARPVPCLPAVNVNSSILQKGRPPTTRRELWHANDGVSRGRNFNAEPPPLQFPARRQFFLFGLPSMYGLPCGWRAPMCLRARPAAFRLLAIEFIDASCHIRIEHLRAPSGVDLSSWASAGTPSRTRKGRRSPSREDIQIAGAALRVGTAEPVSLSAALRRRLYG